jgi:hypothetical protein
MNTDSADSTQLPENPQRLMLGLVLAVIGLSALVVMAIALVSRADAMADQESAEKAGEFSGDYISGDMAKRLDDAKAALEDAQQRENSSLVTAIVAGAVGTAGVGGSAPLVLGWLRRQRKSRRQVD